MKDRMEDIKELVGLYTKLGDGVQRDDFQNLVGTVACEEEIYCALMILEDEAKIVCSGDGNYIWIHNPELVKEMLSKPHLRIA